MPDATFRPRWLVPGDLDGFFALFVDSLLQLFLIVLFCSSPLVGLPMEFVLSVILPGAAVSILAGNAFYSWQAWRLAKRESRSDVCALPYGINTVSLIAYVFFIMAPVHAATGDPMIAWQVGLVACFLGALMEIVGAFIGDWVRRVTPRAALLAALSGVAITFLAMGFVFQIFAAPAIALLPMLIILVGYGAKLRLPGHLPSGMVAVLVGVALAWGLKGLGFNVWNPPADAGAIGLHLPRWTGGELLAFLSEPRAWAYLSVIFPMALFNVVGSLQNLESAQAAGDKYSTRSSLLANGIGSVVAACLGSPFNTTIYIGHPGWKAMGARIGYSAANGLAIFLLCLLGGVAAVQQVVPIEATLGILLWIGIIITVQAFHDVPRHHMAGVALGLVPCFAAWALVLIEGALRAGGSSLFAAHDKFITQGMYIDGILALNQGFLLTSMVLAATLVYIVERRLRAAAGWMAAASVLAFFGVMHAYSLTANGVENVIGLRAVSGGWLFGYEPAAPVFALFYALAAMLLFAFSFAGIQPATDAEADPLETPNLPTR